MQLKPSPVQGPLNGIILLDLTHVLSGPFCTMLLADLGARVIKIEAPGRGDVSRQLGPFVKGKSAYFASFNRGKEGVALDFKQEEDRLFFEQLLEQADVLVENFTTGVMDRLGYGWETLHGRYPSLVYASISGFGRTGPLKDRKANDFVAQAMGGIMSVTGPVGGPPVRVGTGIADMTSGVFAAVGICSALYHREKTGKGLFVDISMVDSIISLMEHHIARYFTSGVVPGPIGNRHPSAAPFGDYETLDGRMIVSTAIDKDFRVLAEVLGRPDLPDDPRFIDIPARAAHWEALDQEMVPILRTQPTAHWLKIFEEKRLRAAPIHTVEDLVNDPQTKTRNMIVTAHDPVMGNLIMQGNPVKVPAFPDPPTRSPAPAIGEHTARIRSELA